jgi:predicted metal-dependent phosphoesterase TrpH
MIDLHLHSNYSDDGEYAPRQVAGLCAQNGVRLFALADHNNTRGINSALKAASESGIRAVPAVELDCVHRGTALHVLGYGIRYEDKVYEKIWNDILEMEREASLKRIRKVRALGIDFSDEKISSLSRWGVVTGEMIAEAAMEFDRDRKNELLAPYYEGGKRSDNPYVNFYWDFCSQGKPAHSAVRFMELKEALKTIGDTGGIPVLAHPGNNTKENIPMLDGIVESGVRGIEVFSSYHSASQTDFYLEYAKEKDLLITCGSDFHGKTKPAIRVGSVDCRGLEEEVMGAFMRALEI